MATKEAEALGIGAVDNAPPPYPTQSAPQYPQQGAPPYPQTGAPPYPQTGAPPYPQTGAPPPHGAYPPSQPVAYYPPSSTQMHSTNVVVASPSAPQQTVIVRESAPRSPTALDIVGLCLAIANMLCCIFPLGLVGVILSGVAFCSRSDGNQRTADILTKVSLALSIIGAICGVIIIIVVIVLVTKTTNDVYDNYGYK
ncbi:uncharacterized protein [Ptychodera flava]|uniref:uncharacterized protein n=1 Tax=Ptychodera flava TaxID=63121 RepID=UPI00396A3631